MNPYEYIGDSVATHLMNKKAATKMSWDWGPAIFLYGLLKFAKTVPSYRSRSYVSYAESYHQHYETKGTPKINWADKVAPALSGHELLVSWGNPVAQNHLNKAMTFLHAS